MLRGFHERFWHAPAHDMATFMKAMCIFTMETMALIVSVCKSCPSCMKFARAMHKPSVKITLAVRFNERVKFDIIFYAGIVRMASLSMSVFGIAWPVASWIVPRKCS